MKKKLVILVTLAICLIMVGCANTNKETKAITDWKNDDGNVSDKEFKEYTKNNNSLSYEKDKFVIKKSENVNKATADDTNITTYSVSNVYLPKDMARKLLKDDLTKTELLTKYIGAAQAITVDGDKTTVSFVTGPRGYENITFVFEKDKLVDKKKDF